MGKRCSIVIRTRNEERWISQCLTAVYGQKCRDFDVIVVDNLSSDLTLKKVQKFPGVKIITCEKYLPGKALNIGIRASQGDYIVCLSGHCIPVNDYWLANLSRNLEDPEVAGAYGRQEPLSFSSDADKRDLLLVFGLDRQIKTKDSFFHNANSIIRRDLWEKIPFDEKTTNIEDRIWAQQILKLGYKIIYDPEASVYHHHGIHQDGDVKRCANIIRIIEGLDGNFYANTMDPSDLNIIAIVPISGSNRYIAGRHAIEYTIEKALASRYIKQTFVCTDSEAVAKIAKNCGVKAPFLRPSSLSSSYIGLEPVLKYSLHEIEKMDIHPDFVVTLEVTFPFRQDGLIDNIVRYTIKEGLDSTIAAKPENRSIWQESQDGTIKRLDSGDAPREFKEKAFIGLKGLCTVTRSELLRRGQLLGAKLGLFEVNNLFSSIEVRNEEDYRIAEYIIKANMLDDGVL